MKEKKELPLKKGKKSKDMLKQNVSKDVERKASVKIKAKGDKVKKSEEAEGLYETGLELVSLGRYEEALDSFEKAIKLKPSFAEAWYNKSLVLGILERPTEAIKAFEKTMALKPELCDDSSMN